VNSCKFRLALGAWLLTSLTGTPSLWAQSVNATKSKSATVQPQPTSPRTQLVYHPVQSPEAAESMLDNHNRFAWDMYQQLGKEPGNLFFSPSSIWTALAMTYTGAAGTTATEMSKTLHVESLEQLSTSYSAVRAAWKVPDESQGLQLQLANRLWGQTGYPILPEFLTATREQFDAELSLLNFAKSEEARQTINSWVEEQTEDKIQELLPEGVIDASTMLVLTNAVYFKGSWLRPFNADSTQEADFRLTAAESIPVPMMHQLGEFGYKALDEAQILELPYGYGRLSMMILLPTEVEGLAELEAQLTLDNLQRWTEPGLRSQKVNVYLPKFKSTSQFELNAVLSAMGMPSAFDPSAADFSKMSGNRELFLSAVIHKAFVDVNEAGTEAAAATGAVISRTSISPRQPVDFLADHPFIYLIRDTRSGALLFAGRVADPSR